MRWFVNVPLNIGYNAGMKSKFKAIGYNLLVIACALALCYVLAFLFVRCAEIVGWNPGRGG